MGSFDANSQHNNSFFSTFDVDNDSKVNFDCASKYKSGWWMKKCYNGRLNGIYEQYDTSNYASYWKTFCENFAYPLAYADMKLLVIV